MRKVAVFLMLCALPVQTQGAVVINELYPNPAPEPDADNERVEIYNTGPDSIDTTGWAIEDAATIDDAQIRRRIPEDFDAAFGTDPVIAPGEFRVVRGTGANGSAYLNNSGGDTVYLVSNRTGNLAAVVDQVAYPSASAFPGQCWANNPDGASPTNFDWRSCTHGVSNCAADAVAPAAVTTLVATSGAFAGEVDLTWNAVGNDGTSGGAALSHIVKYNTLPIDAGNFDASFDAFNAPLPGAPGTPHTMTVFGLDTTQTYWFAIKTQDCQNTSPISIPAPSATPGTTPLDYFDRTAGLQPFYGNLHAHTSYSDGELTPTDAYNYARHSAPTPLDFLAVTDHNHTGAGPMSPALYAMGLAEAAAATEDGAFVAIYGQEWGLAGNGHVNIFEAPVLFGWEAGNFDVFVAQDDYPALYGAILDNPSPWGALAEFCHPGPAADVFDAFAFTFDGAAVMCGVALVNGPAQSTATDESDVGNTNHDFSFQTALDNGYFVSPYADQDNHNQTWGAATQGRTVALAAALTKDDIMGALAARRTYASQDHNVVVDMAVNGWPMGARFLAEQGGGVNFDVQVSDVDGESVKSFDLFRGEPGTAFPTLVATAANVDRFVHRDEELPVPALGETRVYYMLITQDDNHRVWTAPVEVTFDTQVAVGQPLPRFGARLQPARPNPFNPGTEIRFHLSGSGRRPVTIRIHDVRGRAVRQLLRAQLPSGPHATVWDGRDDARRELPSGVYFAHLNTPGVRTTQRLVLLR